MPLRKTSVKEKWPPDTGDCGQAARTMRPYFGLDMEVKETPPEMTRWLFRAGSNSPITILS